MLREGGKGGKKKRRLLILKNAVRKTSRCGWEIASYLIPETVGRYFDERKKEWRVFPMEGR